MDIIFQGQHSEQEATESVRQVLEMLKARYAINQFREMHLTVTLVDSVGAEIELVDSETNQPYRIIEVHREAPQTLIRATRPALKLVVDNTNS